MVWIKFQFWYTMTHNQRESLAASLQRWPLLSDWPVDSSFPVRLSPPSALNSCLIDPWSLIVLQRTFSVTIHCVSVIDASSCMACTESFCMVTSFGNSRRTLPENICKLSQLPMFSCCLIQSLVAYTRWFPLYIEQNKIHAPPHHHNRMLQTSKFAMYPPHASSGMPVSKNIVNRAISLHFRPLTLSDRTSFQETSISVCRLGRWSFTRPGNFRGWCWWRQYRAAAGCN
jgi:hypothetical protein